MDDRIDIPSNATHVRIKQEWLNACNMGTYGQVFPIKAIRGRLPSGAVVVDVIRDHGTWTVILPWRGEFV